LIAIDFDLNPGTVTLSFDEAVNLTTFQLDQLSFAEEMVDIADATDFSPSKSSGPATVAEVPYMECFICNRKYHVESEVRVAIIRGFLSSASTRRNCLTVYSKKTQFALSGTQISLIKCI